MNKETSTYLDTIRFVSALVVMFDHLAERNISGGLGWQFIPFATPAVDTFFVLSGFVIAYVTTTKERNFKSYAISRAARLYSVCLPALILTALLGFVGHIINSKFNWNISSAGTYLQSLFFMNQIWFINVQPGNDGPFWSLGYEVIYYLIFAVIVFAPLRSRVWVVLLAFLLAGPRILLGLPVWLMGVAAYSFTKRAQMPRSTGLAVWTLSMVALAGLGTWLFYTKIPGSESGTLDPEYIRPLWDWREYLIDYAIGILVAVNFVGFYFSSSYWIWINNRIQRPLRWVAGATFTLYLVHYPTAEFLAGIWPWKIGTWPQWISLYLGTLLIVFLLAQVTERKKYLWRQKINLLFSEGGSTKPISS